MKICDVTQFYSPRSGGVKRYLQEKIRYIQDATKDNEHVLIVPGPETKVLSNRRSRIYEIASPVIPRSGGYRALLNLRRVGEILEHERPDLLESSDPYQLGWKAISTGQSLRIPVVGFYHSHFPEAYLRRATKIFGGGATRFVMGAAQRYVRRLYNQCQATLVSSPPLARVLEEWGVRNVRVISLGVNIDIFRPAPDDSERTRESLGVSRERRLLLYVGRIAPEKNVETLFQSFEILAKRRPDQFELLVIGDGPQRKRLRRLQAKTTSVKWIQYCYDSSKLARFYRAADLFVHPGNQETFGLVSLESQACGTPVVGIRGSWMEEIIFHDREEWARENTAPALAEAIEKFSRNDLTAAGAAAATAVAQQYAWPVVLDRLFCIYREVCENYKRAGL